MHVSIAGKRAVVPLPNAHTTQSPTQRQRGLGPLFTAAARSSRCSKLCSLAWRLRPRLQPQPATWPCRPSAQPATDKVHKKGCALRARSVEAAAARAGSLGWRACHQERGALASHARVSIRSARRRQGRPVMRLRASRSGHRWTSLMSSAFGGGASLVLQCALPFVARYACVRHTTPRLWTR